MRMSYQKIIFHPAQKRAEAGNPEQRGEILGLIMRNLRYLSPSSSLA